MGIHVIRHVGALGEGLVLAPERFDPRRSVQVGSTRTVDDLVSIMTENVTAQSYPKQRSVLVLDTTHAYEGFVVLRHSPASREAIGSTKRRIAAGDVIISRLRPYLRQVAYVDEALFRLDSDGNEVCASTEFFVLRGRDGFEAASLVPFLLTEAVQMALAAGQEGGHHPRFSKELLASINVPEQYLCEAAEVALRVKELSVRIREALGGCRSLVSIAQRHLESDSVVSI